MKAQGITKTVLAVLLVATMISGLVVVGHRLGSGPPGKTSVTAYFENTNGLFPGDEVWILGVPVGKIDTIEPQPGSARVTFWFDAKYRVPANAKAAILSPSLVTARAIQLLPAYTGGPVMTRGAVIPEERTAVPVEWDDVREQLARLTDSLKPTQPGGVSPLGSAINTAADNLRDQGQTFRDAITKIAQAVSVLGDHSTDIFSTVKNLSMLVSALQGSADLMADLNSNLAAATQLLANDHNEVGNAISALDTALDDVNEFVANHREALGTTADKLSGISQALVDSSADIKQTLHVLPSTVQNFMNIWQPAQGALTGALAVNNFANPISFLCGAVQAASRLNAEQSAKLCVQYLAPIMKNRQYNFPPLGFNPFVGVQARPNEITYSEDRLRPDYVPPMTADVPASDPEAPPAAEPPPPLPAEATATDPAAGLPGMMVPPGSGS